jgi:hypothetical protein
MSRCDRLDIGSTGVTPRSRGLVCCGTRHSDAAKLWNQLKGLKKLLGRGGRPRYSVRRSVPKNLLGEGWDGIDSRDIARACARRGHLVNRNFQCSKLSAPNPNRQAEELAMRHSEHRTARTAVRSATRHRRPFIAWREETWKGDTTIRSKFELSSVTPGLDQLPTWLDFRQAGQTMGTQLARSRS